MVGMFVEEGLWLELNVDMFEGIFWGEFMLPRLSDMNFP